MQTIVQGTFEELPKVSTACASGDLRCLELAGKPSHDAQKEITRP